MFTLPSSLKTHMFLHTREKSFVCSQCDATFQQPGGLRLHLIRHHTERPEKQHCNHCNQLFISTETLRCHLKLHSGKRDFVCQVCAKSFTRPRSLQDHMISHSNEKLQQCHICLKAFKFAHTLKRHILVRHVGKEKRYSCILCSKKFHEESGQVYCQKHYHFQ